MHTILKIARLKCLNMFSTFKDYYSTAPGYAQLHVTAYINKSHVARMRYQEMTSGERGTMNKSHIELSFL